MEDVQKEAARAARAVAFGDLVRSGAIRAGYDLAPRGGGRTALANDTGMPLATVSRMLSGQTIPDPRFMVPLADAIDVDVLDLFIAAGLLPRGTGPGRPRPFTATDAAHSLGITEPGKVSVFSAMVQALLGEKDTGKPAK
ncbi:helix-turn-helix domain-containing protein [Kitasatospora sp. NBC_00458]|uniref:helix-turn-helix domain-containing protein n=1 Tax=Kitasatospora sp. NBC_00458 TaxID=2903568 RepID=UPI002E180BF8